MFYFANENAERERLKFKSLASLAVGALHSDSTGWAKKVNPKCSTRNFVKYRPILKFLSPLQSPGNLQFIGH